MTWLSAALLALAPCALSQVQLEASGPGVGQVSEPLTLTCVVSGDSVTADYWDWYWQLPRGALDWLGEIVWYNSQWLVRYAPSVQGRVTLSADSSKNQFSLQLRSLTAADTATYYCARRDTVTQRQGPVRAAPPRHAAPSTRLACWGLERPLIVVCDVDHWTLGVAVIVNVTLVPSLPSREGVMALGTCFLSLP